MRVTRLVPERGYAFIQQPVPSPTPRKTTSPRKQNLHAPPPNSLKHAGTAGRNPGSLNAVTDFGFIRSNLIPAASDIFKEAVIGILAAIAKQERVRLSERFGAGAAAGTHQGGRAQGWRDDPTTSSCRYQPARVKARAYVR